MINATEVVLNEQASELKIALTIKKMIDEAAPDIKDNATKALKAMLETNKVEIFDLQEKHLKNLLVPISLSNSEQHQTIIKNIELLANKRRLYLPKIPSFFKFWSQEQSSGYNFLIIIVPLIIGCFIPIVGVAMLILLTLTMALDLKDFSHETILYWSDAPPIDINHLTESELKELNTAFGNESVSALKGKPRPSDEKSSTSMYASYVLIFIISVIGLAACMFPPIGIPAVALLALTVISIAIVSAQARDIHNKRQAQLSEVKTCSEEIEKHYSNPVANTQNNDELSSSDALTIKKLSCCPGILPSPHIVDKPLQTEPSNFHLLEQPKTQETTLNNITTEDVKEKRHMPSG